LLLGLFAVRRFLVIPLRRLESATRTFHLAAPATTTDEIGRLTDSFNALISERKQVEEQLKRSNDELEEFAYISTHDLQEPLRTITLYSQLLDRRHSGKIDGQAKEALEHLIHASHRMSELVCSLTAYSEARDVIGQETTDLNDALEMSLRKVAPMLQDSGATVERAPLPAVRGQREMLSQVLANLIENAVRYRGDRPPRIFVSSSTASSTHSYECIISVRDEGIGIAPEYHQRIFGIFKRLHGQASPGTGMGLAICRRIIENHGGRIWVESEAGHGATFRFTLPLSGPIDELANRNSASA
jgi:light-regulated signal transduction histidine kinase (bacteriophytochrome)